MNELVIPVFKGQGGKLQTRFHRETLERLGNPSKKPDNPWEMPGRALGNQLAGT